MATRYRAELDEIPMRVYIDLVTGSNEGYQFDGMSVEDATKKLQKDYVQIIGGRKLAAEISNNDEKYNHQITLICIGAVEKLLDVKRIDLAKDVMKNIGYDYSSFGEKQFRLKVTMVKNSTRLKIKRAEMNEEARRNNPSSEIPDREKYVRERVTMMEYYKMHIDISVVSAAEYAYMVKRMCDDLQKGMLRTNKKKAGR